MVFRDGDIMITRKQIEKTTAEWESQNPTLAADAIGVEIMSTGYLRYKRGDGVSAWKSLPYLDKIPPTEEAAKIAANFLGHTTANGLLIGDKTSGQFVGYRAQVLADALNILDDNGNKFASFKKSEILFNTAINVKGNITIDGNLLLQNGSDSDVNVLAMLNNRTDVSLGWGSYNLGVGSTYVMGGKNVYLRSGTDAIYMFPCYKNSPAPCAVVVGDSGNGDPNVHPNATGGRGYLGTINYKWKSVYATTGTIQTSDRRLKRNITDDYSKYEKMILGLRPITFDYIDLNDGIERTGFIAQEVVEVMEQCGIDAQKTLFVIDDKIDPESALGKMVGDDHVLGMNYEQFIVPIISVVQKLEQRIMELEKRIA